MSGPALILLAAGIGSRYGGLKQLEPIGPHGESILDYSVYDAVGAGFEKILFVINRDIKQSFKERIESTIGRHCEVGYVYQDLDRLPDGFRIPQSRKKPWGTAHAVLSCREVVDSNFAVINADDFYGKSAFQSLAGYLQSATPRAAEYEFCMVGYQLGNTLSEHGYVSRGVCTVDQAGHLIEIRERTRIEKFDQQVKYSEDGQTWVDLPADSVVSMNIWGFSQELFAELEVQFESFLFEHHGELERAEFFLPEVVNRLVVESKASVEVLPTRERWFGITYPDDVLEVKRALNDKIDQGIYPINLWG